MKYTSIVISGKVATGTTTAAKNIAKKLNLQYHCAGDFYRQYVLEHNIPLYDKAQFPDELDRKLDEELTKLARKGGVVIDAHYIGYFTRNMPQVLKVLLTCDYKERIRRATTRTHTHQETEEDIKKREEGLDTKFRKLYADENFLNPKFFDLVIDNTNIPEEETLARILKKFNQKDSEQEEA